MLVVVPARNFLLLRHAPAVTMVGMEGRPKKEDADLKSYMLRVRMTQEERRLLEEAAKLRSLDLSAFVRSEMLALSRRLLAGKSR